MLDNLLQRLRQRITSSRTSSDPLLAGIIDTDNVLMELIVEGNFFKLLRHCFLSSDKKPSIYSLFKKEDENSLIVSGNAPWSKQSALSTAIDDIIPEHFRVIGELLASYSYKESTCELTQLIITLELLIDDQTDCSFSLNSCQKILESLNNETPIYGKIWQSPNVRSRFLNLFFAKNHSEDDVLTFLINEQDPTFIRFFPLLFEQEKRDFIINLIRMKIGSVVRTSECRIQSNLRKEYLKITRLERERNYELLLTYYPAEKAEINAICTEFLSSFIEFDKAIANRTNIEEACNKYRPSFNNFYSIIEETFGAPIFEIINENGDSEAHDKPDVILRKNDLSPLERKIITGLIFSSIAILLSSLFIMAFSLAVFIGTANPIAGGCFLLSVTAATISIASLIYFTCMLGRDKYARSVHKIESADINSSMVHIANNQNRYSYFYNETTSQDSLPSVSDLTYLVNTA